MHLPSFLRVSSGLLRNTTVVQKWIMSSALENFMINFWWKGPEMAVQVYTYLCKSLLWVIFNGQWKCKIPWASTFQEKSECTILNYYIREILIVFFLLGMVGVTWVFQNLLAVMRETPIAYLYGWLVLKLTQNTVSKCFLWWINPEILVAESIYKCIDNVQTIIYSLYTWKASNYLKGVWDYRIKNPS